MDAPNASQDVDLPSTPTLGAGALAQPPHQESPTIALPRERPALTAETAAALQKPTNAAPSSAGSSKEPLRERDPSPWEEGRVLSGQYELIEEVARGAWGTVWRAWQARVEREVAIKCLIPRDEKSLNAARARFEREAKLASRIRDPSAVRVFDFGHEDGTPFLVMEWIEGLTLAEAIATWGALSPDLVHTIGLRVSAALSAAHECGVIHRDLKPSNIMLAESSAGIIPIVIDFGLARTFEPDEPTVTRADVVIGTPAYLSPEAILGNSLTHACDLYSLGVILAECILGANPFRGKTSAESMTLHLQAHTFDAALLQAHGASAEVADIIMNLLKFSPEERFSSALELHHAFRNAPASAPAQPSPEIARSATLSQEFALLVDSPRTPSPKRRRQLWRAAGLALIVAVGLTLAPRILASAHARIQGLQAMHLASSSGVSAMVEPAAEHEPQTASPSPPPLEEAPAPLLSVVPARSDATKPDPSARNVPHSEPVPEPPIAADMRPDVPGEETRDVHASAPEDNLPEAPRHETTRRSTDSAVRVPSNSEAPSRRSGSATRGESARATLVITASPAGEIFVDGVSHGRRTHVVLRELPLGTYQAAVVREGERQARTIRLDSPTRKVEVFRAP